MSALLKDTGEQRKKPKLYPLNDLINLTLDFCEVLSGRIMYSYQRRFGKAFLRSILLKQGATLTALFARQTGKTQCNADICSGIMVLYPKLAELDVFKEDKRIQQFSNGIWIGIFAPNQRLAENMFSRIKDNLESKSARLVFADPDFSDIKFKVANGETVELTNGSFVTSISASENAKIEGESFKLLILDECQDIGTYKIRKSISPMGAAYMATMVKIGTPTTFAGDFYESIQRNKAAAAAGNTDNHFEVEGDEAALENPDYARYLELEKERYGEESDEYQMSYKLKWKIHVNMLIEQETFLKRNTMPFAFRVLSDVTNIHCIGIDVASKSDSLIITPVGVDWNNPVISTESYNSEGELVSFKAYNTILKDWIELQGEYENLFVQTIEAVRRFRTAKVVIDGTRELAFAERVQAALVGFCDVEIFVYTPSSKSDLYKYFVSELTTGRAKIPYSDETQKTREFRRYMEQMVDMRKEYRGALLVPSHPDTKDAHDDYPDSHALALWGTRTPVESNGFTEVTQTNDILRGGGSRFQPDANLGGLSFRGRGLNTITAKRR